MSKSLKIGILLATIVLPIFIFLYLKLFGENHFTLKTFVPIEVVENPKTGKSDTVFHQIPDFSLINQYGETITQETVKDKIWVVDFFFTSCPSICPIMTNELSRVQNYFKGNDNIVILSHTVNPEEDSVSVLADYAQQYGAIKNKWHLLTGNKSSLYELGEKGYFMPVAKGESGDDDDFIHSEKFILIDKNKNIRGFYNGTDAKEVDRLITEINILLYEYDRSK
jgi:protein SCO1